MPREAATKPQPQLLENGTILVPVSNEMGGWSMSRVDTDDDDYAYWLGQVQRSQQRQSLSNAVMGGILKSVGVMIAAVVLLLLLIAAIAALVIIVLT